MSNGKVTSIAILIGSSSTNEAKGSLNATTVPLVVWTLRQRGAAEIDASSSAWKYDLVYYEFLDDTARWTHLDQLLLQLCDADPSSGNNSDILLPSIHLGSSENLEKTNKNASSLSQLSQSEGSASSPSDKNGKHNNNPKVARAQKLIRSLQRYLNERLFPDEIHGSDSNNMNAHLYLSVPADASRVETSLSHLLVAEEGARLSIRGDVRLSQPLIRQGLALWLQSQGLYGSSAQGTRGVMMEASLQVRPGRLNSCLTMDTTAAQAIHLLPPSNDGEAVVVGGNKHTNSLFGLLSGPCLTAMGKKQLRVWLRQPLVNLALIQQRQDVVTQLLGMAKDSIRDGLRPFGGSGRGSSNSLGSNNLANLGPALAKYRVPEDGDEEDQHLTGRIVDTKKPLEALYHLYVLASNHLPHLLDCMEFIASEDENGSTDQDDQSLDPPILSTLYKKVLQLVAELERSVGLAEAVLDLDQAPDEFLVKPEYDEELKELHRELEIVQSSVQHEQENIQNALNDIRSSGKATQVRLERIEDNTAWQFRLPDTNDSKVVENLGQKIKIHRLLKNGVYFSSLELRQLSAKYQDLQSDYTRLSRKIVRDAMSIASTYSSVVDRAAETIGTLDVFCALAHTAAMSPNGYCKPTMTDSDEDGAGIHLEGARHPCVELQENMEYIPNDVKLNFPQAQLLVSGPNMGGKSVYIRSLGAIVCMAQIGSSTLR